jgi:hypothetical protein
VIDVSFLLQCPLISAKNREISTEHNNPKKKNYENQLEENDNLRLRNVRPRRCRYCQLYSLRLEWKRLELQQCNQHRLGGRHLLLRWPSRGEQSGADEKAPALENDWSITPLMNRQLAIALAVIAFAGAVWSLLPSSRQRSQERKESPGRLVGALPPPRPGAGKGDGVSKDAAKDVDLSLDRIAGASLQEVSDLLASRSPKEISLLVHQLQDLTFGGLSGAKIDLVFKAWAQLSPQDALQTALSFRNGWAKTRALEAILDGTSAGAAAALVNSINQTGDDAMSSSLKQQLIGKGLSKWSQTDPSGAAAFLESSPNLQLPPETWRQIAENWAAQDPKSALDWVQKQTTSDFGRTAMQGMISGWWQKDPEAAQTYSATHTDTLAGQQSASVLANRMAETNPEEAANWASQLTNQNARQMSELTVASGWAANDPKAAAQWAASLPADDQEGALSAVAGIWGKSDPQGAAEWLGTLSGETRDAAVASYASAVAPLDPATALAWALSATSPSIREEAARHIANDWLTRDPSAAKTWIQQSALPDADKAQLLGSSAPSP